MATIDTHDPVKVMALFDALPEDVKDALWREAKTGCPACGFERVPQSWAVVAVRAMQRRPWWRRLWRLW